MLIDLPDRWQMTETSSSAGKWYVWHNHGEGHTYQSVCHIYTKGDACRHCGEPMPDAISGFIQLLQWER